MQVTAYPGYMKEIESIEDAIHNERILLQFEVP